MKSVSVRMDMLKKMQGQFTHAQYELISGLVETHGIDPQTDLFCYGENGSLIALDQIGTNGHAMSFYNADGFCLGWTDGTNFQFGEIVDSLREPTSRQILDSFKDQFQKVFS